MKAGELSVDLSVYKGPNRDRMIELCITELDFKLFNLLFTMSQLHF